MGAISTNTRLDVSDCVYLGSGGRLALGVLKDTYERLGLTGKRSPWRTGDERWGINQSITIPWKNRILIGF